MPSIYNSIPFVMGLLASLATIISPIITQMNQYVSQKEKADLGTKARQRKITKIIIGLGIITIISFIALAEVFLRPSTTSFKARGTLLYQFLDNGPDDIHALTWSPDSSRIASLDNFDGTIQVWDALNGEHVLTYQAPSEDVYSLSWSPDGKYIATSVAGHLYVLEVNATILQPAFVLDSPFLSTGNNVIAWSPDGTRIAIACSDKDVRVLNVTKGQVDTNQRPLIYTHHSTKVYALSWSPDGKYIASASTDNTIQIWDISKGDKTYRTINYLSLDTPFSNVAWSPDSNEIAAEDRRGIVLVWNYSTGKEMFSIKTYPIRANSEIHFPGAAVAWSPNNKYLATSRFVDNSYDGKIQLVLNGKGSVDTIFLGSSSIVGAIKALAWSPNGSYIASAGGQGVAVWQARGVDNWYPSQVQQEDNNNWVLVKFDVIYGIISIGIVAGGSLIYESLSKRKETYQPKPTRRRRIFSTLGILVLVAPLSYLLGMAQSSLIIEIFGQLNLSILALVSILGLTSGYGYLVLYILYSMTERYILPSLKRRYYLRKAWRHLKRRIASSGQQEYRQAVEICNSAIELDHSDAEAYNIRAHAYLKLRQVSQAKNDYSHVYELDPTDINAAWMAEWAGMSKQHVGIGTAWRLELIAKADPYNYIAYVCRGIALGLRGKVKNGLGELKKAIPLSPEDYDAYFWQGMLSAYYYQGQSHDEEVKAAIEQSLKVGLPPILLTPLYWLEKDRPDVFVKYAKPLLLRYSV